MVTIAHSFLLEKMQEEEFVVQENLDLRIIYVCIPERNNLDGSHWFILIKQIITEVLESKTLQMFR